MADEPTHPAIASARVANQLAVDLRAASRRAVERCDLMRREAASARVELRIEREHRAGTG
jgi:hypothetical protein